MVYGRTSLVPGREKAARENCGTNKAWPGLATMYCTGRVTTCLTLTTGDCTELMPMRVACVSSTRRYRVTVLTSSGVECVRWTVDPTLTRGGADLIRRGGREVDR